MNEEIDTKVQLLLSRYDVNKLEKQKLAFNLFTLSTYGSQLENFHSDILAKLFDPNGLHQEQDLFLKAFLQSISDFYEVNLESFNSKGSKIKREEGRIDIGIIDYESNQAILIENKINDAEDQDRQLDRYYEFIKTHKSIEVKAIIYLTLDGVKIAPPTDNNIDHLVYDLSAYSSQGHDLVSVLSSCYPKIQTEDTAALINQYIKLLKKLNNKVLDETIISEYYHLLSEHPNYPLMDKARELYARIPSFRGDTFMKSLKSYAPFKKYHRYQDHIRLFQKLKVEEQNLKLDVVFNSEGTAHIIFWNEGQRTIEGRDILTKLLNALGLIDEFDQDSISNGGNGYIKTFRLDDILTMAKVDRAVADFTNEFLAKLDKYVKD